MNQHTKITGLILFLLIGLTTPFNVQAQFSGNPFSNFVTEMSPDGFVVLNNWDTIRGKIIISWKYVENNPVEIQLVIPNQPKLIFKAGEIRGFSTYSRLVKKDFDTPDDFQLENYICVPSPKKGVPVFMKVILDGSITVLENRSSTSYSSEIVEEKSKIEGISFSYNSDKGLHIGPSYSTSYRIIKGRMRYSSLFVSKNKEALLKLDKKNYESLFSSLFGDCPAIKQELEKNPDLSKFINFTLLAEIYNRICMPLTKSH